MYKVWVKKNPHMFKNWPLKKNPQFLSNPRETCKKWLPHEVIIFPKFYEDFLLIANFWTFGVFSYSDFSNTKDVRSNNWSTQSRVQSIKKCTGSLWVQIPSKLEIWVLHQLEYH